jgi:hypothetical protein
MYPAAMSGRGNINPRTAPTPAPPIANRIKMRSFAITTPQASRTRQRITPITSPATPPKKPPAMRFQKPTGSFGCIDASLILMPNELSARRRKRPVGCNNRGHHDSRSESHDLGKPYCDGLGKPQLPAPSACPAGRRFAAAHLLATVSQTVSPLRERTSQEAHTDCQHAQCEHDAC